MPSISIYPQYGMTGAYDPTLMYAQNGMLGNQGLFNQGLYGQGYSSFPAGSQSGLYNPAQYNMQGFYNPSQLYAQNGMLDNQGLYNQGYLGTGLYQQPGAYDTTYGGLYGGGVQQGYGYNPYIQNPYSQYFYDQSSYGQNLYGQSLFGNNLAYPYGLPNTQDPYAGNLLSIVGNPSLGRASQILSKFYDKNQRQYPGETTKETWDRHLESDEKQLMRSAGLLYPGSPFATLVQVAEGSLGPYRTDQNPYVRWFGPYANQATTPQLTAQNNFDPFNSQLAALQSSYYPTGIAHPFLSDIPSALLDILKRQSGSV